MDTNGMEAFNRELFEQLCRANGWDRDAERARVLRVSQSTIHRIQSGEQRPALKFANQCRRVFGLENFVRLFPLPDREEPSDANS
jgi:transcriptional regulator with XRE-family HTH domain